MNFLAHLFLSCQDEELMIGNFIADSISNRELPGFSKGVQEGIVLHRKIDSYTDSHPSVRASSRYLHPYHGKYSPVLIDVYYDYLLASNWHKFSSESLDDFVERTYKILTDFRYLMPPVMQARLPLMIKDNWLKNYSTESGLNFTFERMRHRVKYPELLQGAPQSLFLHLDDLNRLFLDFFPDLQEFVDKNCLCD